MTENKQTTAEEILFKKSPMGEYPDYYHERCILEAMEEYAAQFQQSTDLQTCINELNKRIEMYDDNPVFNEAQLSAKEQHIYGLQEAITVLTIVLSKEHKEIELPTPSIDYEKEAELLSPISSWYDINIIRNAYIKIYNQAFGKK